MDNEGAIYVSKRVYILDYSNRNVSINDRICCLCFCVVVYVSCLWAEGPKEFGQVFIGFFLCPSPCCTDASASPSAAAFKKPQRLYDAAFYIGNCSLWSCVFTVCGFSCL